MNTKTQKKLMYSVEICRHPIHLLEKHPRRIKWIDLDQINRRDFDTRQEALNFARTLDRFSWRIFIVTHSMPGHPAVRISEVR